ncbi:MAG: response regulator transcription factor [Candidatus Marinimicrobia bacterium]|nr:response regulator transcription factor [Candidatus Neomarinimicrobiota bacterium]
MKQILVIEDEAPMRLGLIDNLEFEGYQATGATDGQEGYELIRKNQYDLILLDIMLPKLSGFDLCKKIRSEGITTPIIMLTAKGEEIDRVLGLELGADDYITKPFSLRELIARVKAVLRRYTDSESHFSGPVEIGRLSIDFQTYNARSGNEEVSLSYKEFEILKCLWKHRNATVNRDQLLSEVWGYDEIITTRTIDNFILKLRQKLEENPKQPYHILTVHGIGYKLVL